MSNEAPPLPGVAAALAAHGQCPTCKREPLPDVEEVADAMSREDGQRLEWRSYDDQERFRTMARVALAVIA